MTRKSIGLFLIVFLAAARLTVADESISQEELLRRSQELFDSVVSGNKEPWQKYFADDALYFDEKGRNMNKTALVADITRSRRVIPDRSRLERPDSRIVGDTAVV